MTVSLTLNPRLDSRMGKRERKVKDSWECGDCNAMNDYTKDWCDAPEHEWAEKYLQVSYALQATKDQMFEMQSKERQRFYLTKEEFTQMYTNALNDYLTATFTCGSSDDRKLHPEDLAASIATFNDATYALLSNYKFN